MEKMHKMKRKTKGPKVFVIAKIRSSGPTKYYENDTSKRYTFDGAKRVVRQMKREWINTYGMREPFPYRIVNYKNEMLRNE